MKKINVYCITYGPHRLDSEKLVINKLVEVTSKVDKSILDIQIFICDNNSPNEFKEWLRSNHQGKLNLFLSDKNIGKARIVNKTHKTVRPCDYVCSFDSDMLIKNDNFFECMSHALEHLSDKIGLVCANQDKGNIHMMNLMNQTITHNNFNYLCSNRGGTAGSVLMIKNELWNKIGGYAEFDNIFGGNDGWVVAQVTRKLNLLTSISVEGICDHIGEHTKEYHQWKVNQATHLTANNNFKINSGYYDN